MILGRWIYRGVSPEIADSCDLDPSSWVIGNVKMGKGVVLKPRAVLRGDGQDIKIGRGVMFLSRSTVHIANDLLGAVIGDYSVIGRYSLIHACTIGKSVLVGDQAVIMDDSVLGDECLVTANSLIPPGKRFSNNVIIDGAPAKVIGTIKKDQLKIYKEELINSNYSKSSILRAEESGEDPIAELGIEPWIGYQLGKNIISKNAFVAPDSVIRGKILIADKASVWFSTVLSSIYPGFIEIGEGTNVQDNTIIDLGRNDLKIGKRVTVGHNVRLGSCNIGDDCLIGMGSTIEDGAIIEDSAFVGARALVKGNTVVKSKTIFAGRPAKYFREIREEEYKFFEEGQKGYEQFSINYIRDCEVNNFHKDAL